MVSVIEPDVVGVVNVLLQVQNINSVALEREFILQPVLRASLTHFTPFGAY